MNKIKQLNTYTVTMFLTLMFVISPIAIISAPQNTYATDGRGNDVSEEKEDDKEEKEDDEKKKEEARRSQAAETRSGSEDKDEDDEQLEQLASEFASCALSQILATGLSNIIGAVTSSLTSEISSALVSDSTKVPVKDASQQRIQRQERAKEVSSLSIFGIPILPSMDAIAYCLTNAIIQYIGHSTVNWANQGQQGNPSFVNNNPQYNQDLGDIEAERFIRSLADQSGGVDIPKQYISLVQRSLAQRHLGNSSSKKSNVNDGGAELIQKAQSGQKMGWGEWAQIRPVRTIGSIIDRTGQELFNRVTGSQRDQQLQLGWADSGTLPRTDQLGRTTVPGGMIADRINNRLALPEQRLVQADEFDEMLTQLINAVVKIGLGKLLEEVQ